MDLSEYDDTTIKIILRFNHALNHGDVDSMMNLMSEDCVFENTSPAPDGSLYRGKVSVRRFWEHFFRESHHPSIQVEEIFACNNRGIMRWIYTWMDNSGMAHHIRGIDVYLIRDGLIAQKLSYVKG